MTDIIKINLEFINSREAMDKLKKQHQKTEQVNEANESFAVEEIKAIDNFNEDSKHMKKYLKSNDFYYDSNTDYFISVCKSKPFTLNVDAFKIFLGIKDNGKDSQKKFLSTNEVSDIKLIQHDEIQSTPILTEQSKEALQYSHINTISEQPYDCLNFSEKHDFSNTKKSSNHQTTISKSQTNDPSSYISKSSKVDYNNLRGSKLNDWLQKAKFQKKKAFNDENDGNVLLFCLLIDGKLTKIINNPYDNLEEKFGNDKTFKDQLIEFQYELIKKTIIDKAEDYKKSNSLSKQYLFLSLMNGETKYDELDAIFNKMFEGLPLDYTRKKYERLLSQSKHKNYERNIGTTQINLINNGISFSTFIDHFNKNDFASESDENQILKEVLIDLSLHTEDLIRCYLKYNHIKIKEELEELNLDNKKVDVLFLSNKMACTKCLPVMDEIFKILTDNKEIDKVYFGYYKERSTTEPNHFYKEAEEASTKKVNYFNASTGAKLSIPLEININSSKISNKDIKPLFYSYSYSELK